jgi:hypothetical protein
MKEKQSHVQDASQIIYVIPKTQLDQLLETQQRILQILEGNGNQKLGDYLSEEEVKKMLGRKTTWFWRMRNIGKLSYTKVGGKVFYFRKDIEKLIESGRIEAYDK